MSKRYLQWGYESFKDTKTCEIYDNHIDLLNQQDKRIKELKEENQQLKQKVNDWKQRFEASEKRYQTLQEHFVKVINLKNDKIKQLKQAQKQLAIEELEKLKYFIDYNIEIENDVGALKLQEFYDNQIKKLRGGENE